MDWHNVVVCTVELEEYPWSSVENILDAATPP